MKKFILIIISLISLFTISSCSKNKISDEEYERIMTNRFQSCSGENYFKIISKTSNIKVYEYFDGYKISDSKLVYNEKTGEISIEK